MLNTIVWIKICFKNYVLKNIISMVNKWNLITLSAFSLFLYIYTISQGNVEFKRFEMDGALNDIIWCGPNHETVFALTQINSLYRSDDKGFSWTKLNDIITSTGKNELEENEHEIGKVSRILISPVDKNLVVF